MRNIQKVKTKEEFMKFLTDNTPAIGYDNKKFVKHRKGKLIKIKAEDELIYEIHEEKKMLIVTNAFYCGYNKDEYWGIANEMGLEEVLADPNTLIRV